MTQSSKNGSRRGRGIWRAIGWSLAALLLLLPLIGMQITDEINWTLFDFIFAGALMLAVGVSYELAAWRTDGTAYRAATAIALAAAFLLIWMNGAVGIIGSEGNPANLMYGGVIAVGIIGSLFARFQPREMVRALLATAVAQATVAMIALAADLGAPHSGPAEIVLLNGFFVALFIGSALLFRQAAGGGQVT